jgi:capsular polysaccharide transport system ATP-binding protein
MAVEFDTYLVDEIMAVGDARFQARCTKAFRERRSRSDVIVASHNLETLREYCDMGAVIADGRIAVFDRLEDAIASYQNQLRTP